MSDRGTTVNINVTVAATLTAGTAAATLSHGGKSMDFAAMATPDSYIVAVLITCIVTGILSAIWFTKYCWQDTMKRKGKTVAEMPYDYVTYGIPTVIGTLLAMIMGTEYGGGFNLGLLSITGAGCFAYCFFSAVFVALAVCAIVYILYNGVDVFITDAAKVAADTAKTVKAVSGDVATVQTAVKDATAPATDAKTEAAAVDSSSTRAQ